MKDENGKILEVHPFAARFPLMNDEELADLAEDIKTNGLKEAIVIDCDGTLIDGRNRRAACKLAGVEPATIELNSGQDPVAFISSRNLKRRNLSRGQQAMLIALGWSENKSSLRQQAAETEVARSRIMLARFIIKNAPDLVDLVLVDSLTLEQAYEKAQERKKAAQSDQAKTERLNKEAPDLAEQVSEGKLSLAEATGAFEARLKELKEAESAAHQSRRLKAQGIFQILTTLSIGPMTSEQLADEALIFDGQTLRFMKADIGKEDFKKAALTLQLIAKKWNPKLYDQFRPNN